MDSSGNRDQREYYPSQAQSVPAQSSSTNSPFAFAPPPLSIGNVSNQFKSQMYLSDGPTGSLPTYPKSMLSSSYPYSSAPMGFRSYSNDLPPPKAASNSPANMTGRTPNMDIAMGSPLNASFSSPYAYSARQVSSQSPYASTLSLPSPQPRHAYPYMQAPEMPRSLTYPSYAQSYASPSGYPSSMSTPPINSPHAQHMRPGDAGAGPIRQPIGYSFANRLPLVDKPFKCDECVQSFNRNHDLKRHKRIHLAVKPFGCEKCGKTFSRKDALRRHWLVKGCRGDEGATAPILPMFPITGAASRARPLSPPTPPPAHLSPPEAATSSSYPAPSGSYSLNRTDVPPLLNTMPSRSASVRSGVSQVILTPNDLGTNASMSRQQQMPSGTIHLEDPIVIEPSMGSSSTPPTGEAPSYFEMNPKSASDTSMLSAPMLSPSVSSQSAQYRSFNSPAKTHAHHPYRRNPSSPGKISPRASTTVSPSDAYLPQRTFSPSGQTLGSDGKPAFAVPFTPDGFSSTPDLLAVGGGTSGSGSPAEGMSRQSSGDSDPSTWQRWHRPSFPFPQPGGVGSYQYDGDAMDVSASAFPQ